jgi:hypothetical protein
VGIYSSKSYLGTNQSASSAFGILGVAHHAYHKGFLARNGLLFLFLPVFYIVLIIRDKICHFHLVTRKLLAGACQGDCSKERDRT